MKNMFLLIVVPVLLVTQGFGQADTPSSNTNPDSIKGCISMSDSNYTIVEDGTAQTFKVTSSTVDLKAHVGHDVEVTGQKTNAAASSGSSDNTVVITGVNMISEHCATASAAAASNPTVADPPPAIAAPSSVATADSPTVTDSTPVATASTSAAADPTPATTTDAPGVTDSTPTATASSPAVTDQTPTAAPAVADPTPAATDSAPMIASASAPEGTGRMPDTATSLPLLGLLGLGLLATGLVSRRSRTN